MPAVHILFAAVACNFANVDFGDGSKWPPLPPTAASIEVGFGDGSKWPPKDPPTPVAPVDAPATA